MVHVREIWAAKARRPIAAVVKARTDQLPVRMTLVLPFDEICASRPSQLPQLQHRRYASGPTIATSPALQSAHEDLAGSAAIAFRNQQKPPCILHARRGAVFHGARRATSKQRRPAVALRTLSSHCHVCGARI